MSISGDSRYGAWKRRPFATWFSPPLAHSIWKPAARRSSPPFPYPFAPISRAALVNYLPAHIVLRLSDMKPIYHSALH